VFHIDVAKVDQDVIYVAMVIHMLQAVFCKHVTSVFLLGVAI
jgi:hypothetical protein